MKFSYNWIRELVDGVDVSPKELGELITMKTAECEGVEEVGAPLAQTCAARIKSVEQIPDNKNKEVVVETGKYGTKTVVCGAPNCRDGMTTAYVPAGVKLGDLEIRKAEIAGVTSDGMLASGAELGINRDAEGILEFTADPGQPIPGCAPDSVIEIDNKSLTHRPDLWGHHGLAREVAAILRKPLRDPVNMKLLPAGAGDIEVSIADLDLCPRYSGLTFENLTVQQSPLWLQWRLEAIDLNPINNIVDVTNFVMAEISEPMHAFDRDALAGNTIFIRPAKPGESTVLLNEEHYDLDPSMIVIADAKGPVAVGGVMGGLDSSIVDGTTRMVLEAANFHAASVRKTSSKLKLRTDASVRFEKSQDPRNTVRGLARAVELFNEVSPGVRLVGGVADSKAEFPAPPQIALHIEWLARKLGRDVEITEVKEILRALDFSVEDVSPKAIAVAVPSWRATRDVSIKDDLLEEVGRIVGYDSITPHAPEIPSSAPPPNEERQFHHDIRTTVCEQGFAEVYNHSFVNEEMLREFGMDPEAHVHVINPIASDLTRMRVSLVPGICANVRENAKHLEAFRLFEIGYEIHKKPEGLPREVDHLIAAIYSREGDGQAGLFELKRLAECLLPTATVAPTDARPFEHPARSYFVHWRSATVGRLFELHPKMGEGRSALLEINLDAVHELGPIPKRYRPLHRYPTSSFDLSVLAGERELSGDIQQRLTTLAGEDLESISFVRRYSGPQLPPAKQSLSYRLTVFAPDHTLTTEEVNTIRQHIIDGMQAAGYELRV